MGFTSPTGNTRFDKREQARQKTKNLKEEQDKRDIQFAKEEKIRIAKERKAESRRGITLKQKKVKKTETKKRQKSTELDKASRIAAKVIRESEEVRKEATNLLIKERLRERRRIRRVFDTAQGATERKLLHSTNQTQRNAVNSALSIQNEDKATWICRGNEELSTIAETESQNLNSLSVVSRERVLGILIYIDEEDQVKIPTLCSMDSTRGVGTFLLRKIGELFNKDLVVDSLPSAIGFYESRGFVIERKDGGLTQMRKTI